jgi:hypothetical protein
MGNKSSRRLRADSSFCAPKLDVWMVAAYRQRILWIQVFDFLLQQLRLIFLRGIETRTHIHTAPLFPQAHLKLLLGDHLSL